MNDLRYAIHSLLRNPAFAVVSILTLALAIGANTAMFSVFNSVLLRPLAYWQPEGLYVVQERLPKRAQLQDKLPVSAHHFLQSCAHTSSFDSLSLVGPRRGSIAARVPHHSAAPLGAKIPETAVPRGCGSPSSVGLRAHAEAAPAHCRRRYEPRSGLATTHCFADAVITAYRHNRTSTMPALLFLQPRPGAGLLPCRMALRLAP